MDSRTLHRLSTLLGAACPSGNTIIHLWKQLGTLCAPQAGTCEHDGPLESSGHHGRLGTFMGKCSLASTVGMFGWACADLPATVVEIGNAQRNL